MSDGDQAIRDVLKGASIVYIGLFLELVIAFVAQVVAARYLSVGGFGGLTAGTALLDIGSIVASLGLASGLTRYFPRIDPAQKRPLTLAILGITVLTAVPIGIAVSLNAAFIAGELFGNPGVTESIRVFSAAIPFAALLSVAIGGIRGQEQSLYRVLVKNIVHPVARITLVAAAVTYGLGQAGLAGAYALPYILSSAIAIALLYRTLPRERSSIDRDLLGDVTRYSVPFVVSGVTGFIYRSIDIFLVLYFLGDSATGIYGVAYAAVSFMGMFSTAFNYLGSPITSKLESDGNVTEAMRMFRFGSRWLVIASICTLVPLGVFATEFITVVYQSKYASGGPVLTILAVGFAVKNVLSIHNSILEAIGRSKTLSLNSTAAGVTNLGLNIVLIPTVGITGAAIATVVSFALRDGLAAIQVYREIDRSPLGWQLLQPLGVGLPFLLLLTVVSPSIPSTFLWLLAVSGLAASAYVFAVLIVFGISPTEVMIVRSVEERFGIELGPLDRFVRYLADR